MSDVEPALRERFPAVFPDEACFEGVPLVPADLHLAVAKFLKEALGFTQYVTVCASHWPSEPAKGAKAEELAPSERWEVATVLRRPGPGSRTFAWRVALEVPRLHSLVSVFAGADWQEREQYDLVGVVFEGHPDLRRLMLPEDWEGHPLRKDYAIDTPHPPWR